jgi:hypothetical protein
VQLGKLNTVIYGDIPADYFIWLDESSVDDYTNQCTHGWAAVGHACVHRATFIRGQRYSILPALTSDGIITLDIFEGSVNKEKFIQFLKEDLVCTLHLFVSSDLIQCSRPHNLAPFLAHKVLLSWTTVPSIMMKKFRSSLWASVVS